MHVCFIALEVKIGRGSRLPIPPDVISSISGFQAMFAKCKLVNANGHSKSKGSSTMRTPAITATANPNWENYKFSFDSDDRLDKEFYMRIEIVIERMPMNLCIGAVFIPLEYFENKEVEYTFPLTRFRQPGSIYSYAAKRTGGYGLGSLTVKIRKVQQSVSNKMKLNLRTTLRQTDLFNTSWVADCLPAGAVESDRPKREGVTVAVLNQGLYITEIEGSANVEESRKISTAKGEEEFRGTSMTSTALKEAAGLAIPKKEVEIAVFENQRTQPYPPFDWSTSALTRPNFSDLEFNVGYKFDKLSKALAPEGWEWVDNWSVDKKHIQTDAEGWIYGATFSKLLSNYKRKRSYVSADNCYARRRRWVRRLRCLTTTDAELPQVMRLFEKAQDKKTQSSKSSPTNPQTPSTPTSSTSSSPTPPPSVRLHRSMSSVSSVSNLDLVWRKEVLNEKPNAVLGTCKEKLLPDAPVVIVWKNVLQYSVITPSVLSIVCNIERFIPSDSGNCFKPAQIELFLVNCPAQELYTLLEERRLFHGYHRDIQHLVLSGNIFGREDDGEGAPRDSEVVEEDEDRALETEELSMGSETVADLDSQTIELENKIHWLQKYLSKRADPDAELELSILRRRVCRLRLYMAAMFGVSLSGLHSYQPEEVRKIMDVDFRRARRVEQSSDVATASNRIDYLLDMAEKRIRDAALCGWQHRGEQLERCLEIFANGYFVEIVSILGYYFEDIGQSSVKVIIICNMYIY
jgi:hypothetical protein